MLPLLEATVNWISVGFNAKVNAYSNYYKYSRLPMDASYLATILQKICKVCGE